MGISKSPTVISLTHSNGDSTSIALQGATVVSYISSGIERLFTSSKSDLAGPAAIRGGIPICWPIFGPPVKEEHKKMKQHGFARTSKWDYVEKDSGETEDGVKAVFQLESSPDTESLYPFTFHLEYTVLLTSSSLKVSLSVLSPVSLSFQALFHSYLRLPPSILPPQVQVKPLEGLKFADKVQSGKESTEGRAVVEVDGPKGEVDRVYFGAPDVLEMEWKGVQGGVKVTKTDLADVVLWNPGPEKGAQIGDMEKDGANHYVCLEPGQVGTFVTLDAQKTWEASVELSFSDGATKL